MAEKTTAQIARFIDEMRFKKVAFGISEEDVVEKIHELNRLYQAAWEEENTRRVSTDGAYQEKLDVLTNTLVKIKRDNEETVKKINIEKEQILHSAKAEADKMRAEAKAYSEQQINEARAEAARIVEDAIATSERHRKEAAKKVQDIQKVWDNVYSNISSTHDLINKFFSQNITELRADFNLDELNAPSMSRSKKEKTTKSENLFATLETKFTPIQDAPSPDTDELVELHRLSLVDDTSDIDKVV